MSKPFDFGSLKPKEEKEVAPEVQKEVTPKILKESKPKSESKKAKLTGDKYLNKDEIVDFLIHYIEDNKQYFTLDWLRGQKLTFESVNEMRRLTGKK